jgi:peptide/nickel transport system substrate-binding protein
VLGCLVFVITLAGCSHTREQPKVPVTLRIGVGRIALTAPEAGMKQLIGGGLSQEALVGPSDDGRMQPWLAESWTTSADGLTVTVKLRDNAKFHDGTPVTAEIAAQTLRNDLPDAMGPAFDDIEKIDTPDPLRVRINLRRASPFVLEALESLIQKPGNKTIGTGPYVPANTSTGVELDANPDYYLGRPSIDRVTFTPFSTIRTAWAELLRGNVDMLNEVNIDALDSLSSSNDVRVFSYLRHYQYMIIFAPRAASLLSDEIRRELSAAIDREEVVREGLNGHGVPSTGPVPPLHWALDKTAPKIVTDPLLAKKLAARHLTFTCLVPADSVYERVALVVKRQLAAVSVDMRVQEVPQEQLRAAAGRGEFDAVLGDIISGPTLFRSYRHWHSKLSAPPRPITSLRIDAALDRIRHAASDGEYRAGVTAFQQAMVDDPVALFLAWGERARAVSRRFEVVAPNKDRDILGTLRLWRPASASEAAAARN